MRTTTFSLLCTATTLLTACGEDDTLPKTPPVATVAAAPVAADPDPSQLSVPGDGWFARSDDSTEPQPENLSKQANQLELKYAPSAAMWIDGLVGRGDYRLSVSMTHLDSGLHPHGAGLTFGGTDIEGDQQRYTYFMVRSDQMFLIKTRDGGGTTDVMSWADHEAIAEENQDGTMHNKLAVEVRGNDVRFLVNGVEVHRDTSGDLPLRGLCGFRLVHDLHIRFDDWLVEPINS